MELHHVKAGAIVEGPFLSEPVQVYATTPIGTSVKIMGKGMRTGQFHDPVLTPAQLELLIVTPEDEPFNGDAGRFRLGVEAMRLGLAYEYDPYFALSIARVHPLPHQLEAVYEYFLKQPRIRFLLADDPGAGKTIMAGLLLKELKIRGLVRRTLIMTPANLTFQWQREMKEKFHETFEVMRGDVLRANYGMNPWQERNQVVTSVSWVSRVEDAKESLLRSNWDLIIVDEAHKMSAGSTDNKTLAYVLGERLSEMTDHFLLMTATPHKGDPKHFCLFLELLDKDVYADVESLEEAMRRNSAPFYLRRTKEALVTFPDAETGQVKALFTRRKVDTREFELNAEEMDFYDALTRYVEDQSYRAASDDSARGRALGFTMAMLQRRFASSVYAVRRSLERMKERREKILQDPEAYREEQITRRLPDDYDELPDDEREKIRESLEEVVGSVNPEDLREEILDLGKLIEHALQLERREVESKLTRLRRVLTEEGAFADPRMKLLIFTEHKDTLDYLVARMRDWGLSVTQIHGQMKVGDRDTPGTRIYAEREFRESCQVLVATEAAGEGINLQFCWFLINYDIPWNPMRLEQRMGRIHRYGQEKDCLIFNFVASNTREGAVLQRLFERIQKIEADLDPKGTGKVFNVLGDVLPANYLEKMVREMYARSLTLQAIEDRIIHDVDPERFRRVTECALEGLARRQLNLASIVGKKAEAKERRLVPEVIEDFFGQAALLAGLSPRETAKGRHVYRIGRTPRVLWELGDRLEPRFGRLGRDYKEIVFDQKLLEQDATWEWVTPGHPLFECVRSHAMEQVEPDLRRGAVFYDLNAKSPSRLDVFSATAQDGRGNILHRRLFLVECSMEGGMTVRQPTFLAELAPAPEGTEVPVAAGLPSLDQVELKLVQDALQPFLQEIAATRERETRTIREHLEISLNAILVRVNDQLARLQIQKEEGSKEPGLDGRIRQTADRVQDLMDRLERRTAELTQEQHCTIADIRRHGRAWVLPHPERDLPHIRPMVRDDEIERIAIHEVIRAEEARGMQVESVESENRGFDLISRRPHPEDPRTALEVRFIEVKGRAGVGEVALSENEHKTAIRLGNDYWLYAVFHCAGTPEIHIVQNPARLGWKPLMQIAHWHLPARQILEAEHSGG